MWDTQEEVDATVRQLRSIEGAIAAGVRLPSSVFEGIRLIAKNISTEVVVFDNCDRVYLAKRPSLAENPAEPYPEQFHSFGVTHGAFESDDEAKERLIEREIGPDADLDGPHPVTDLTLPPDVRGRYMALIHIARCRGKIRFKETK